MTQLPLNGKYQKPCKWALLKTVEFKDRKNPSFIYMRRRYLIATPWFSVLVHDIYGPDSTYHVHDHPWNFFSIILRGGYKEVRLVAAMTEVRQYGRWDINKLRAGEFHTISQVQPLDMGKTTTLVFTGPRFRKWGFLVGRQWVEAEEYFDKYFPEETGVTQ